MAIYLIKIKQKFFKNKSLELATIKDQNSV